MKFKFKRYKIYHKGKPYYVLVPEKINENIWVVDWADWWYATFLTGSLRAMKILAACFAILGFNPYVIIYLPVGNDRITDSLSYNPDNGKYDIVFCTNRAQLKDKDWKAIRGKLKKAKWTTYKFKFDEERIRKHFKQRSKFIEEVPQEVYLKKAGAGIHLGVGTAFINFPRARYEAEALDTWDWIERELKDNDRSHNYREQSDSWTCDMRYFCFGGYNRAKYTHERPGCSWILEMYDINIANRYRKKKDYFVKPARIREKENKIEGFNQFTYASTNVLKITLGGKKKKEASQEDSP